MAPSTPWPFESRAFNVSKYMQVCVCVCVCVCRHVVALAAPVACSALGLNPLHGCHCVLMAFVCAPPKNMAYS